MTPEEIIHRHIDDAKDSLEIGTPGKMGCLKIYGSFDRPDEFKQRIDRALEARAYAAMRMETKEGGAS